MDYPSPKSANPQQNSRIRRAFEIIATIIIILIVGAILLPTTHHPGRGSMIARTRQEMKNLEAAILQYQAVYGRLPVSSEKLNARLPSDFTFGTYATKDQGVNITNSFHFQANNSEVMAILMDVESFFNGLPTANSNHLLNPGKHAFFSPAKIPGGTDLPGLGSDGVLRDHWGHPYIICIDMNNDGNCRDALYQMASVSEVNPTKQAGLKNLSRPTSPPYNSDTRDTFQIKSAVMIWSMGPDGKADFSQKSNEGVNKDNILSWE